MEGKRFILKKKLKKVLSGSINMKLSKLLEKYRAFSSLDYDTDCPYCREPITCVGDAKLHKRLCGGEVGREIAESLAILDQFEIFKIEQVIKEADERKSKI